MKKTFASILVLCVLLCGVFALTACNGTNGVGFMNSSNKESTYDYSNLKKEGYYNLKNNQSNTIEDDEEVEKFTVNFVNLGDTYDYSTEVESGSSVKLPKVTKLGYEFVKWQQKVDNNYIDLSVGADNTIVVNSDITISATWEILTFEITYNFGNGSLAEDEAKKESFTVEDLPMILSIPNLEGNCFTGYNVKDSNQKIVEIKREKSYLKDYNLTATYDSLDNCFSYAFVDETQSYEITGYKGKSNIIALPNEIAGKPVTTIDRYAFKECNVLTDVVISESVTKIEAFAFKNCAKLNTLAIGSNVTNIEAGAFSGCVSLTRVVIPKSVENIGNYAFQFCGPNLVIYCETGSQPEGWSNSWFFGKTIWQDKVAK